jgi:hypothetical protein
MNSFMRVMADIEPDGQRCEALAIRISKALVGYSTAEAVMGLCFHLNRVVESIPDDDMRADAVAGLMRMIDPSEGSG